MYTNDGDERSKLSFPEKRRGKFDSGVRGVDSIKYFWPSSVRRPSVVAFPGGEHLPCVLWAASLPSLSLSLSLHVDVYISTHKK